MDCSSNFGGDDSPSKLGTTDIKVSALSPPFHPFFQILFQLFSCFPHNFRSNIIYLLLMVCPCLPSTGSAKVIHWEMSFVKFMLSVTLHLLHIDAFFLLTSALSHFSTIVFFLTHWEPCLFYVNMDTFQNQRMNVKMRCIGGGNKKKQKRRRGGRGKTGSERDG